MSGTISEGGERLRVFSTAPTWKRVGSRTIMSSGKPASATGRRKVIPRTTRTAAPMSQRRPSISTSTSSARPIMGNCIWRTRKSPGSKASGATAGLPPRSWDGALWAQVATRAFLMTPSPPPTRENLWSPAIFSPRPNSLTARKLRGPGIRGRPTAGILPVRQRPRSRHRRRAEFQIGVDEVRFRGSPACMAGRHPAFCPRHGS